MLQAINNTGRNWLPMDQGTRIEKELREMRQEQRGISEALHQLVGSEGLKKQAHDALVARVGALEQLVSAHRESALARVQENRDAVLEAKGSWKALKWIAGIGGLSGAGAGLHQLLQAFGG